MNDNSTGEVDSEMCWVSKDQKFHTKNGFGGLLGLDIDTNSNEYKKT